MAVTFTITVVLRVKNANEEGVPRSRDGTPHVPPLRVYRSLLPSLVSRFFHIFTPSLGLFFYAHFNPLSACLLATIRRVSSQFSVNARLPLFRPTAMPVCAVHLWRFPTVFCFFRFGFGSVWDDSDLYSWSLICFLLNKLVYFVRVVGVDLCDSLIFVFNWSVLWMLRRASSSVAVSEFHSLVEGIVFPWNRYIKSTIHFSYLQNRNDFLL